MLFKVICSALLLASVAQAIAIERGEGGELADLRRSSLAADGFWCPTEHSELERRAGCPRGKYMGEQSAAASPERLRLTRFFADAQGVCTACPTDASACALKAGKLEIIAWCVFAAQVAVEKTS